MDKEALRSVVGYVGCFVFGLMFNVFTARSEREGWIEPYISLCVAFGVAVTVLLMGWAIGWENVLILTVAFFCSGIPMILGSISRHLRSVRMEDERIVELVKGEDDEMA